MSTTAKILARNPRLKKQMDDAKAEQGTRKAKQEPSFISMVIPMRAIPLERHRHHGGGSYLPTRSRKFREAVQDHMRLEMNGRPPMSGPLHLQIRFCFARPKTGPNSKPDVFRRWSVSGGPDGSNLQKAVEDAANGILWHDDAQISDWSGGMNWSDEDLILVNVWKLAKE